MNGEERAKSRWWEQISRSVFVNKPSPHPPAEDKRIDRLLDYTKFHIGLYLTLGAGFAGVLAVPKDSVFSGMLQQPRLMIWAVLCMAVAGLAGGVIASTLTHVSSFSAFWNNRQGPWSLAMIRGKYWTWIEHSAFWLSLLLAAASLLGGGLQCALEHGKLKEADCKRVSVAQPLSGSYDE
jgi:hypothetical protein